jgi:RimJ/RimL family protein N-acetyltransferase
MFARTERLLLRPGWEDDAAALHEAIAHEAVAMKLSRLPWPYTLEDAQTFLAAQRQREAPHMLIFARTAGKPKLIGGIGLDTSGGTAELGYWISPPFWGLGFATEAARAVVNMARESLPCRKVVARHFVDNPASGRVLQKNGFREASRSEHWCQARRVTQASITYTCRRPGLAARARRLLGDHVS